MTLLLNPPLPSLRSSSSSALSMSATAVPATPVFRLHHKPGCIRPQYFDGVQIGTSIELKERRRIVVAKASAGIDEVAPDDGEGSSSSDEDVLPIDKLPLESKLQLKLEQKMKMKIAKKVRLRRKRLVRKRRMRKKGRWPPSKVKKNKNV